MKFAFFKTKIAVVLIGLILGLMVGFKIANSQYRREQGDAFNRAMAQSSNQAGNSDGEQSLTPQERETIMKEVSAATAKAKGNPQDVEAQLDAANHLLQINNPEEAISFLQQANKVDPNDSRAMAGLGMANFMMNKYDEAIQWSKRSITKSPKNPGATFIMVASFIRTNRNLDEAERLINQLESDGVDREMITQARQELNAAKSSQPQNPGSKTMLQHGPRE